MNLIFISINYFFGILVSLFSVLLVAMAIGIISIDDVIFFLNLEDPIAGALREIYSKVAEAAGNISSIIYDVFSNSFGDKQGSNEGETRNIVGDTKE